MYDHSYLEKKLGVPHSLLPKDGLGLSTLSDHACQEIVNALLRDGRLWKRFYTVAHRLGFSSDDIGDLWSEAMIRFWKRLLKRRPQFIAPEYLFGRGKRFKESYGFFYSFLLKAKLLSRGRSEVSLNAPVTSAEQQFTLEDILSDEAALDDRLLRLCSSDILLTKLIEFLNQTGHSDGRNAEVSAFIMSELEGMPLSEIALAQNTTVGTVKTRLSRCRAKLRPWMEKWCEENT